MVADNILPLKLNDSLKRTQPKLGILMRFEVSINWLW